MRKQAMFTGMAIQAAVTAVLMLTPLPICFGQQVIAAFLLAMIAAYWSHYEQQEEIA